MNEIGSFFEFPCFDCVNRSNSTEFYIKNLIQKYNLTFLRDGRQAIKFILSGIPDIHNINCHIPSYLCHSIIQPFEELKLKTVFYGHSSELKPALNQNISDSVIFLIDYFGVNSLNKDEIKTLLLRGNRVILDVTHSILNKKRFNIYHKNLSFAASLRKIFPIPDGAVAFCPNPQPLAADTRCDFIPMMDAMILKKSYIEDFGNLVTKKKQLQKKMFLSLYSAYETKKDLNPIICEKMPLLSQFIMKNINVNLIIMRRNENLTKLYEIINNDEIFLFERKKILSPFFLPIVLPTNQSRENLMAHLIKHDIYPAIHWVLPESIPTRFRYEHSLSKRILSVPVDQRYNLNDMERIANLINKELS